MSLEIPGVLWRRDPRPAGVPLVFDSPHSGSDYPEDFRFTCSLEALRTAEDAHVDELYAAAPEFGATLLAALFPRSYVDANRATDDLDTALLEGVWPRPLSPSHKTRAGLGLVRRVARSGIPIYDRRLTVAEVMTRVERYYTAYHRVLDEACSGMHRKFGVVWHVNCHSMPSQRRGKKGGHCADFVLGDRDGSTCAPEFTEFVAQVLRGLGYTVRINEVYKGVEIVKRQGRPAASRHSLQIEVDRALYMDQKTLEKTPGFASLQADISRLIEALGKFASERLGERAAAADD
ncbi:MAG TPA: N-formylglutamate amidohydrolase [Stellaceae bacterium]|jgi:N-formylglutamate amidohydrolase|nr:N-formylglutamate amidohydrolase [Stellaceae bacterium]